MDVQIVGLKETGLWGHLGTEIGEFKDWERGGYPEVERGSAAVTGRTQQQRMRGPRLVSSVHPAGFLQPADTSHR